MTRNNCENPLYVYAILHLTREKVLTKSKTKRKKSLNHMKRKCRKCMYNVEHMHTRNSEQKTDRSQLLEVYRERKKEENEEEEKHIC